MASATDSETRNRSIAIAEAPPGSNLSGNGDSPQPTMPYSCQICAKRKVKCDKATPVCSSCRRGRLECFYQAPLPRMRKRKSTADVLQKLARYERILRQHGLLDAADASPSSKEPLPEEPISVHWNGPEPTRTGKLLASQGKSKYIDSDLWRNLGGDEMESISDEEDEDSPLTVDPVGWLASDPLTGAFMGYQQTLLQYHPTHANAMILWETHRENVEPICKVLHIPTTAQMVETISQQPVMASKADDCLLFAIYHFAVFSMSEDECVRKLGQPRVSLMQQYHFAARQALVNASFLKTTEMSILQALILFLIPCQDFYDSHTLWILTGVAVRIGQRMGIHRDGEKLGLPPFDVQMRRRLFYQLLPLDGKASQKSGTVVSIISDDWDVRQPLNINDNQIWPGMVETPEEQKGATDMIFCLSRSCVGKFFAKMGPPRNGAQAWQFKDYREAERAISEIEREVEEKYIRYCDIINPLHFLTMGLARSGITAMRLRIRLPKVRNQTATDSEMVELLQLAQKILDTDVAASDHPGLRKYQWHMKPFFLWGMWDSLLLVLTSLRRRRDLFSPADANAAWNRVEQVYLYHDELLESKRGIYVAWRHLTLTAWEFQPPSCSGATEPAFITTLRSLRKADPRTRVKGQDRIADAKPDATLPVDPSPIGDVNTSLDDLSGNMSLDVDDILNMDGMDWMFWDQLMQDYRAQGSGQQGEFSQ